MPESVTNLVNRLGRTIHCLQYAEGLNPAQWEALRYFQRANRYSRSPSALAKYLRTTKGTASQTLKALETKGLVARVPHPRDRRGVLLELTQAGADTLKRDPLSQVEKCSALLDGEVDAARDVLRQLVQGLEASLGACGFGVCESCNHLRDECTAEAENYRCGLTGEPLAPLDIKKICVNHSA